MLQFFKGTISLIQDHFQIVNSFEKLLSQSFEL